MTVTEIRNILENPYDRKVWKTFLQKQFTNNKLNAEDKTIVLSDKTISKQCLSLGNYEINEYTKIGIFEITLNAKVNLSRNRVALRSLLKDITKQVAGAMVVFVQGDKWRFSYISKRKAKNNETNTIEEKETSPKRYTYLFGKGEKALTAAQRLLDLANKEVRNNCLSLDDFENAFSVSVLTKEFYNELFQWYQWILTEDVGITFPRETIVRDDSREKLEEQIIRLITRLLFVWFIKQKGLVPNDLFDKETLKKVLKDFKPNDSKNGNYYNAILQNLFFATLNKSVTERAFAKEANNRDIKTLYRYSEMFCIKEKEILELFKPIPFLNGGLFECLDKDSAMDGIKYHLDGFSRNDKKAKGQYSHRAFIPNCVFFDEQKGLIPLLERYNFTVEESAPEDVQVALDPELLGNVFENLLGAFNNETKESARKQSGSFYTPREIVNFMVSESLQAYLQQHIGNINLDGELTDVQKKKTYDTLLKVKILDPACGSGAFPMGILNGIIAILEKIGVAETLDMYKLKLHLIENCIYGVDLQTIAAQISKLRFFISLIVEQKEKDPSKENYGVITLPNLETKFVAANTLIGLHKKQAQGNLFEDPRIESTKQEILAVRHEHFYAKTAKEKKQLREKDARLRSELVKLLENNHEFAPEDAKQVAQWNPYDQNASSPFFDAEWMFGVKDGFDIVIGNPPYVQLQKEGGRLAKQFEKIGYKTFERTGDIYSLFYEKGTELLKTKGHLCFITSNKWMRAGYGESTRQFFAKNTNPILLVDFAGQKIFDSATVDTNILLLSKEKNQQKTLACVVKDRVLNNLSVFTRHQGNICAFNHANSWIILSDVEQRIREKVERVGTPLKKWNIQINYGIKTGFNEAFIIDGGKRKEIIEKDPKSEQIIRPILRGRDIKRYGYEFADLYLITTFPSLKIDIEKYQLVKSHLLSFGMERLEQTGKEYKINGETIKARKKTTNKWFETQDSINYWEDFSKQKIIWKRVGSILRFSYDETGAMALDSTCFATGKYIKFLVAVLNSKMGHYLMKDAPQTGTGDLLISVQAIEPLKIPIPNADTESKVNKMMDLILNKSISKKGILEIEEEISTLIYEMYKLDKEEIEFIESQ